MAERRRRRKQPAGERGCLCNGWLFELVWGLAGSGELLAAGQSCGQGYLFLRS